MTHVNQKKGSFEFNINLIILCSSNILLYLKKVKYKCSFDSITNF